LPVPKLPIGGRIALVTELEKWLKATDMAFKLLGAYLSKKHEIVYSSS
jgi:hypothetical protein